MDVESVKKYIDKWKWLQDVPGNAYRKYSIFTHEGKVVVEGDEYITSSSSERKMHWDFYVYENEPLGKKRQFKFLIEAEEYDSGTWTKMKERLLVYILKKTLINALMEANDGNHDNGDEIET